MAGNLHPLIRLHEWIVDERRRKLADLLDLIAELENQGRNLERELIDEQRIAGTAPEEAGLLYGNYAKAVIARRQRIAESVADAESKAAVAREAVREAYRELKKYQVAQAARDRRQAEEEGRREQIFLDEIGIQGHRRRHGGMLH